MYLREYMDYSVFGINKSASVSQTRDYIDYRYVMSTAVYL